MMLVRCYTDHRRRSPFGDALDKPRGEHNKQELVCVRDDYLIKFVKNHGHINNNNNKNNNLLHLLIVDANHHSTLMCLVRIRSLLAPTIKPKIGYLYYLFILHRIRLKRKGSHRLVELSVIKSDNA